MLDFYLSLLDEQIKSYKNNSSFLIELALLGVKENGWYKVNSFPFKLSSILKISRFLIIRYAYKSLAISYTRTENSSENSLESDLDSPDISGSNLEHKSLDRLTNLVNRFIIKGTHSPIHWILDLRAYSLKIARNSTSIDQIDWDEETILYSEISFSMSNFRGFLYDLVYSTRTILFDEILFKSIDKSRDISVISWTKIHENPLNNSLYSNFLHNSQLNLDIARPQNQLFNRISLNRDLLRRFEISKLEFTWNRKRIESYFDIITLFLEKLLILIYISGDQLARAPEILSLQYSNSIKSDLRNIFYENDLIYFVIYYHKDYSISEIIKIIYRYLSREIEELLVYYL